jgi:thiosulfate reductase cytochrome b subunit
MDVDRAMLHALVGGGLRLRLSHEDLTVYNAVQKTLYLGVILVGILIVITGLCLWPTSIASRCTILP